MVVWEEKSFTVILLSKMKSGRNNDVSARFFIIHKRNSKRLRHPVSSFISLEIRPVLKAEEFCY